jgi:hypothetical protein
MSISDLVARTGRVQSWIDDPTSRLPVSCTVFSVDDSVEGENGIEASWRFVSHALRFGAGCAVHLTNLRPKGSENANGLVASGPVSFAKIYSTLNEVLRRGGVYKNGAVVCHIDLSHPDILEFINVTRNELPWVKRCVNLNQEMWEESSPQTKEDLLRGIRQGDIWLNKIKYDREGERIYGNVCLEVYLPSRGTCLLQHINLGACDPGNMADAFVEGMKQLCELHAKTNVDESGEYLSPEVDRQVGLGMLGLANLLRRYKVSYKEFGQGLEDLNHGRLSASAGYALAEALQVAIKAAAEVAREHGMVRAFAIAPTASCSYRYKDPQGFTTTPEIAPPISRHVDRDSGTFGVQSYDYGEVEIASEVGWAAYKKVADGIMTLLDNTGLLHGYSFNSWSDIVTYDNAFVEEWLASPQTSLYYSLQVMHDTQDKSNVYAALEDTDVDDYLEELLSPVPDCNCGE